MRIREESSLEERRMGGEKYLTRKTGDRRNICMQESQAESISNKTQSDVHVSLSLYSPSLVKLSDATYDPPADLTPSTSSIEIFTMGNSHEEST